MFKISASVFGTVGSLRRMRACTDEFLATVTEGVYKVVAQTSFGVTQQHKASGDKWMFCHCITTMYTNLTR